MPWLSHVNGSYFALAETLLMVLREVLVFVEEHLPVAGDVEGLAVGIGFRILLGQGLERVGLTGLLGGSLLGFPAGLIRFGLLGILDGFGLGAEISLPGYGLGDLRRGGLTSRFQGPPGSP